MLERDLWGERSHGNPEDTASGSANVVVRRDVTKGTLLSHQTTNTRHGNFSSAARERSKMSLARALKTEVQVGMFCFVSVLVAHW